MASSQETVDIQSILYSLRRWIFNLLHQQQHKTDFCQTLLFIAWTARHTFSPYLQTFSPYESLQSPSTCAIARKKWILILFVCVPCVMRDESMHALHACMHACMRLCWTLWTHFGTQFPYTLHSRRPTGWKASRKMSKPPRWMDGAFLILRFSVFYWGVTKFQPMAVDIPGRMQLFTIFLQKRLCHSKKHNDHGRLRLGADPQPQHPPPPPPPNNDATTTRLRKQQDPPDMEDARSYVVEHTNK